MPELRKDPLAGRWVIIATERARRPGNIIDPQKKSFDEDEEKGRRPAGPKEKAVYTVSRKAGRSGKAADKVTVLRKKEPLLTNKSPIRRSGDGLHNVLSGYGAHEAVIETAQDIPNMADLDVKQIELVLQTYAKRVEALSRDKSVQHVFLFKNYGGRMQAKGSRSSAEILASPVIPLNVREKLNGAKRYFDYHERCIFADIILEETKHQKRIAAENGDFIAVMPFASRFPFEITIIPKKHDCNFFTGIRQKEAALARILKDILSRFKYGLEDPAYTMTVHSAPFRRDWSRLPNWQTIEDDFRWHIEIVPRLTRPAGFEKGSGFYICPIPPEYTAEFLNGVEV